VDKSLSIYIVAALLFLTGHSNEAMAKTTQDNLVMARGAYEDGLYGIAKSRLDRIISSDTDPERVAEAYLLRGQCHFSLERYSEAQEDFEEVKLQLPNSEWHAKSLYWLGECAFRNERFEEAGLHYQGLVDRFPRSDMRALAFYGLGWSYYSRGQDELASQAFKTIIKEYSRHPIFGEAQFKFAETLYHLGRHDESGYLFRQFLKKQKGSPLRPVAYFWLGEINYQLERFSESEEDYKQALAEAAPKERKSDAWAARANYGLAWAAFKQGHWEDVLESLDRFGEYFAKHRLADAVLYLRGITLEKLGRSQEAILAYEELLRRFPESSWMTNSAFRKAHIQRKLKSFDLALASFLQMEREDHFLDMRGQIRYAIGQIAMSTNRFPMAIRWLKKALEDLEGDESRSVNALILLGDARVNTGEIKEALEVYDRVLSTYTEAPVAALAQYRIGEIFYLDHKYDFAISAFRSLMVNFPESNLQDYAHYKIGWSYFHLADFETARDYFAKVRDQFPNSHLILDACFMEAESLYNSGRFKDALARFKDIRKAEKNANWDSQVQYGIAWSAWRLGDENEALQAFEALSSDLENPDLAGDALHWLGQYAAQKSKWKDAQGYFRKIMTQFPKHDLVDDAMYWTGWVYYQKGDVLSAVEIFKSLAARYKESPLAGDSLYWVAKIMRDQKKIKNALNYYQRALEIASPVLQPEIQYHLAQCYQDMEDRDQAILEYLKVVYLYSEAPHWATKAHLQVAWLFEREERWQEAQKIYGKIAVSEGEEAIVAKNRLAWIEEHTGLRPE
jgi:TolA-binding protein